MYTTVYYHTQVTMEEQTKAFIIQDTNEVCTVSTKEEYLLVIGISSIKQNSTPSIHHHNMHNNNNKRKHRNKQIYLLSIQSNSIQDSTWPWIHNKNSPVDK
mmetsp:Transcript_49314/g.50118  ORF Transcript_49314/g.50118 Transcript_49314/m.50118 type:complete len:101 (+) Transcript_49314:420-722(+)